MIEDLKHPTWDIHDASKLKAYMTCPRKYFYEYVLGWRINSPNHDLVFGEAWHRAMAHIMLNNYGRVEEAINAHFLPYYRQSFSEVTDLEKAPKNPGYALANLIEYVQHYKHEDKFSVEHIEVYGTVPTMSGRLHFRLDTVCKDERGYFCLEHKTTKMDTQIWDAEWALSMQTSLYNHVLMCMYGYDNTYGVIVNGVVFRKSSPGFKRVNVRPTKDMMKAWLYDVDTLEERISQDFDVMFKPSETSSPVMNCFSRNTEACTKYHRVCAYHAFCSAWANPLQKCDKVPVDFKVEYWNPADAAKEAGKEVVEID